VSEADPPISRIAADDDSSRVVADIGAWQRLQVHAEQFGVTLDERQVAQFQEYLALLCEWNRRFNLTAIQRPEEVLTKHFLDSLTCATAFDLPAATSLLDVGSGAGFPGLVLAIAFPHLHVTVLDSIAKRAGFLRRTVEALGLEEVRVVHARVEEVARPGGDPPLRERFDVATARAVARINVLAEWLAPCVRVGGSVLFMKGPQIEEELSEASLALRTLGLGDPQVRKFVLPGTDAGRALVTVPKVRPTPPLYPRTTAEARRRPL
jgi:16S rRNA (guanine527-N7)-methyltransferase